MPLRTRNPWGFPDIGFYIAVFVAPPFVLMISPMAITGTLLITISVALIVERLRLGVSFKELFLRLTWAKPFLAALTFLAAFDLIFATFQFDLSVLEWAKKIPVVLSILTLFALLPLLERKTIRTLLVISTWFGVFAGLALLNFPELKAIVSDQDATTLSSLNRAILGLCIWCSLTVCLLFDETPNRPLLAMLGLLIAFCFFIALQSSSQSAVLYLFIFCSCVSGFVILPRTSHLAKYAVIGVVVLLPLLVPFLPSTTALLDLDIAIITKFLAASSAETRIEIWRSFATLIWERPLTGWGFGVESNMGFIKTAQTGTEQKFGHHPHSMPIQLWLNFGLIGVILFCVGVWKVFRGVEKLKEQRKVLIIAHLCAMFLVWCVSHGAWQSWWLFIAGISLAILFLPICKPAIAKV